MIKNFFSNYLSSMTLVFSIIILLNSILDFFQIIDLGDVNLFILTLAFLIVLLFLVSHLTANFNFRSSKTYHLVNCSIQLIIFILLASMFGAVPVTIEGFIINSLLYITIYYFSMKWRIHELNQLAQSINERLSNMG